MTHLQLGILRKCICLINRTASSAVEYEVAKIVETSLANLFAMNGSSGQHSSVVRRHMHIDKCQCDTHC
jgi:hypothetical protein